MAALLEAMEKGCSLLPSSWVPTCDKIATALDQALQLLPPTLRHLGYASPLDVCQFLSACQVDCCLTASTPEQLHLALTNDITSRSITWLTLQPTSTSVVQYGLDPNFLNYSRVGILQTYQGGGWNGWIHTAIMTDLVLDHTYYYRVGDSQGGWSPVYSFSAAVPSKFAVIGDMGVGPNSENNIAAVIQQVQQGVVDCVLHVGDISYADGIMRFWDIFFRKLEAVTARVPYMVVVGNHEIPFNFTSYKHRFWMPRGGDGNMFWSLDVGSLRLVAMSTESPINTALIEPPQLAWIKEQISTHPLPFTIVMGHRPLYCSSPGEDCDQDALYLRGLLEQSFLNSHVDVVLTAHVHNYERTVPVFNGQVISNETTTYVNPKAPVYVMNGAGGNREGVDSFKEQVPAWSASRVGDWGYGNLFVSPTMLKWVFYRSSDNQVVDQFTITKS
eukprot:TRINITY_DN3551_c0_g1_i6.p1 TRINITY_DN3551_c0_g1~~TRINITY_DN3551_c0_g1_i6.p1  ORF type:complete len:511 (-),score=113.06 TRINITY_DN3551_c0_g1_i6:90-1421(-)